MQHPPRTLWGGGERMSTPVMVNAVTDTWGVHQGSGLTGRALLTVPGAPVQLALTAGAVLL